MPGYYCSTDNRCETLLLLADFLRFREIPVLAPARQRLCAAGLQGAALPVCYGACLPARPRHLRWCAPGDMADICRHTASRLRPLVSSCAPSQMPRSRCAPRALSLQRYRCWAVCSPCVQTLIAARVCRSSVAVAAACAPHVSAARCCQDSPHAPAIIKVPAPPEWSRMRPGCSPP
eukprot:SAG25_NODE_1490_length_2910_cov_29.808253_2_plen_176_part_00